VYLKNLRAAAISAQASFAQATFHVLLLVRASRSEPINLFLDSPTLRIALPLGWQMLDEQADSGSSADDNGWQCRQLGALEDLARQSCASALAKCVPVKNVDPDVCFLVIDSSGKTRCAENAFNDSSGKRRCGKCFDSVACIATVLDGVL